MEGPEIDGPGGDTNGGHAGGREGQADVPVPVEPARQATQEGWPRDNLGGLTLANLAEVKAKLGWQFTHPASILKPDGNIECATTAEYFEWQQAHPNAHVLACDTIRDAKILTVFLGLPTFHRDTPDMKFETMVMGGLFDNVCYRYRDAVTAQAGHAHILRAIREADEQLTLLMHEAEQLAGI